MKDDENKKENEATEPVEATENTESTTAGATDGISENVEPNSGETTETVDAEIVQEATEVNPKQPDNNIIEAKYEEHMPTDDARYAGIEGEVRRLISSGHMFKAHELAKNAFEENQDDVRLRQIYSMALLKTGAMVEAKNLIYPLLGIDVHTEDNAEALNVIDVQALRNSEFLATTDADILGDLGSIFQESWPYSKSSQDLDVARELYTASFNKDKNPANGIHAAWLSWLTGEDESGMNIAEEVLHLLPPLGLSNSFADLINLAETQLLLNRPEDALRLFTEAMKNVPKEYVPVVNVRQHLNFLKTAGFKIPPQAYDILTPPTVVVFTGYPIDHPSYKLSLFPLEAEEEVKRVISEKIEEIDARIGYSSASCGADLLFIEAMLERGAEVNIVLPYAISDFLESNVRYAGPRWEKRFERAIERAHSVSLAVEDRYLGHDMLYRFSNNVMHGMAAMRSKFLTTSPHLMAVWHSRATPLPGGPSDFIDRWNDIATLHLIDLDELNISSPADLEPELLKRCIPGELGFNPFVTQAPERVIKAMMFSDLRGYSKLQDEHVVDFLDFMEMLHDAMDKIGFDMESVNTWGDAIFAVANSAIEIAEFGLKYCDIIEKLGENYTSFPMPIRARISLHAGPVFVANDPFIKKMNFYGGHINRAARLEPVTTVGQVYATHQFVSLLHTEISNEELEFQQQGLKYFDKFSTEYVGLISLAKNFGQQEVYHLRWNN